MMAPRTATPPITPPAIAPTGVDFFFFGDGAGETGMGEDEDEDVKDSDSLEDSLVLRTVDVRSLASHSQQDGRARYRAHILTIRRLLVYNTSRLPYNVAPIIRQRILIGYICCQNI
jgi:hypothetical protein